MSTMPSELTGGLALNPTTAQVLSRFARRRRVLLVLRTIAAGVVFFVATMLIVAACDYLWLMSDAVRWVLSLAGYAICFAGIWWFGLRRFGSANPRVVARQLESVDPRLREDLLSAVELADPIDANGSDRFRDRLQRNIARRTAGIDVSSLLPIGLVRHWISMGVVVTICCLMLMFVPQIQFGRRIARAMLPGLSIQRASLTEVVIVAPSPASGYVAEGDAIGVVVRISGMPSDQVTMQWRTVDGAVRDSVMSPRATPTRSTSATAVGDESLSAGEATLAYENLFAANLSMGGSLVEYRIIAGDAITLWHTLIPLPRPRVEVFSKRYMFPAYAKLDERLEEAQHGDLQALAGSTAKMTIRFDEPVENATLRFGSLGATYDLDPQDESKREFQTSIPIKTPARYQIDATSLRSGLNNPFSPQYTITPIIDTAPTVRWGNEISSTIIVSPLDVVSLTASATDDLPMDRIIQEFQLNGEPVIQRDLKIFDSARELQIAWDWDLTRRIDDEQKSLTLANGDMIRTRIVAIDRLGQRGESPMVELLVAEKGFDSDRHWRLDILHAVAANIVDWSDRAEKLLTQGKGTIVDENQDAFNEVMEEAIDFRSETTGLLTQVESIIAKSNWSADAGTWELIGRGVLALDLELGQWFANVDQVMNENNPEWQPSRERRLRDLANQSDRHAASGSRINQYARAAFAEDLCTGLVDDALSLRGSLQPLLGERPNVPVARLPRYLAVVVARLNETSQLIDTHDDVLPTSTVNHLTNWHRFVEEKSAEFRQFASEMPRENELREWIRDLDHGLMQHAVHATLDGQIVSTLAQMLRDVQDQIGAASDLLITMKRLGEDGELQRNPAEQETDSSRVAELNRDAEFSDPAYHRLRDQLLARLSGSESLHRSRPHVDLQFAADMRLLARAIDHVTGNGFEPYREESAAEVHDVLAGAFRVIEGKHEADILLHELRELLMAERQLQGTAANRIKHASAIERFRIGMEWPVSQLKTAGIDWKEIENLDKARYSDDYQQANQRIVRRRWSTQDLLSAESDLDPVVTNLTKALVELGPRVAEARAAIAKYVLTLPELARQASEKAIAAKQRTQQRPDQQQETIDELSEQQQQVEESAEQTIKALVDFANTAEMKDAEQRELARDADAAAALIQEVLDRVEQAMQEATNTSDGPKRKESLDRNAVALQELAEALEQTADHFENAENGEDISESREQLRQAELDLRIAQDLQQRFERAKAIATAAQASPETLLQQLEQELGRNEPMQQELSEIAERAADLAQQNLERAALDEANLNQSLERSDAAFQERKSRLARQLDDLAHRARTVDQAILTNIDQSLDEANTPDVRPELQLVQEHLRNAINAADKMGGESASQETIDKTARDMAIAIEEASKAIENARKAEQDASDKDIHDDDNARNQQRRRAEQRERRTRDQRVRDANNQKIQWNNFQRQAEGRIRQAEQQQRAAEREKENLERQIKQGDYDRESLRKVLDQTQQRIDQAQHAEDAARASRQLAKDESSQAAERANRLQRQPLDPLEQLNPAAQSAERMADQAKQELHEIVRQLNEVAEHSDFGDQLRVPHSQAQPLARQQQRITEDVIEAAEHLRRAARHEHRLGNEPMAEKFDQAAQAINENAAVRALQATESLKQAAEDSTITPTANDQLNQARQQISKAATALEVLLADAKTYRGDADNSQQGDSQLSQGEPSSSKQRGQQLAQTLDDLDRTLNQPRSSGSDAQGQPQDSQQNRSVEGSPQKKSQPGTAVQASPTLARMMDNQTQRAARQRQQQMNPSQAQQPSEPSQQSMTRNPSEPSSRGEMPDGDSVETANVNRQGSQWGKLQERRTEDAIESRAAKVAPQYRREVEAYFRAIARRAAQQP